MAAEVFYSFIMQSYRARHALIALFAVACGIMIYVSYFRNGYDALILVADLAKVDLPLAGNRSGVSRQAIAYPVDGRRHAADLYVPERGIRAGLVMVPGAAENGRNDPRLVDFAESIARSGFVILVPDIVSLRQLRPSPHSAREIRDAFAFLREEEGLVPGGWLGISALSIATGPAVLAAMDPAINDQVRFLLLIGGYHDMVRTLAYLTTGYFDVDGRQQHSEPNQYGKWVYALSNSMRLQDPDGQEALATLARRKLENPAAPVEDLKARLDPEGEAVYDFITNTDPARVSQLMNRLPKAALADIAALNLAASDLSALKAKVILIHGRDDDIIPYTESISLADALPRGQARLYLLNGLHHVDRDFQGMDLWRSWLAMQNLLTQDGD